MDHSLGPEKTIREHFQMAGVAAVWFAISLLAG
jgi:hypothetical protein